MSNDYYMESIKTDYWFFGVIAFSAVVAALTGCFCCELATQRQIEMKAIENGYSQKVIHGRVLWVRADDSE